MMQREGRGYLVRLQADTLSLDEAHGAVQLGNVGAIAHFVGITRRFTAGRGETVRLKYDCYEDMALAEMARLCSSALADFDLERVFISHRTGVVPAGEASVIVAASSAHRNASLSACRALIDGLKEAVPIWKKEMYADGDGRWIEGDNPSPPGP